MHFGDVAAGELQYRRVQDGAVVRAHSTCAPAALAFASVAATPQAPDDLVIFMPAWNLPPDVFSQLRANAEELAAPSGMSA